MASKGMVSNFEIKTINAIKTFGKVLNTEGKRKEKKIINLNEHQKKSSVLLNYIFSK